MDLMIDTNYLGAKVQQDEQKRIFERERFIALKKLHDEQTAEYLKQKRELEKSENEVQTEINDLMLQKASLEHEKELLEIENKEICIDSTQLEDLFFQLKEESDYERKMLEDSIYYIKLNTESQSQAFSGELQEINTNLSSRLAEKEKEYKNYIEGLHNKRSELKKGVIALENEIIKTENELLDNKIKHIYTKEGIFQKIRNETLNVHSNEKLKVQEQSMSLDKKIGKLKDMIDNNKHLFMQKLSDSFNALISKHNILYDERNNLSSERSEVFTIQIDYQKTLIKALIYGHKKAKLDKLNCYSRVCLKDLEKTKLEELSAFNERKQNAIYMQDFSIDSKKKRLNELENMLQKSSLDLENEQREMDSLAGQLVHNINAEINNSVKNLY